VSGQQDDLVVVGRVARAHGNRGQVIVNLETDFPDERFRVGQVLLAGRSGEALRPLRIDSVRFHQGRPIIALDGIETMTEAEGLAGQLLHVPASSRGPLPVGTFYREQLVGCDVTDVRGTNVGTVRAIDGPMERSHLVVSGTRGEMLIPLAADICVRIEPSERRIVIDPPEGLLELNERKPGL
jgi:16S rRNA processing protein RimM